MKYLKYILSLLLIITVSACDSFLGNPEPQQSLPLDGGISTAQDIENLLVGAYNNIQSGRITGSQSLIFSEIMADNTVWTGSFPTYVDISARNMDSNNNSIRLLWNTYFSGINAANIILSAIQDVSDPELEVDRVRGEALFIRGLLNFSAVRLFGLPWSTGNNNTNLGIPIKTTPVSSSSDFENPQRNTVAEVYGQVVDDLQEAVSLLPNSVGPGRANSLAATALLARVRLNQREYQAAADLAGQVISSSQYSLDSNVTNFFFNELTGESIFEIIHTVQDNPGINLALPAFYATDGRDDIQVSSDFISATEQIITAAQSTDLDASGLTAEDTRVTQLLTGTDTGTGSSTDSNSLKFNSGVNTDDNAPILRYADILLIRAESLTELASTIADVPQEVFDLVNQIRRRAIIVTDANGNQASEAAIDYQRSDFSNKQELLERILLERRVELAFEGERLPDLQRRQLDVRGLAFDADVITMPIPQTEIDANPEIMQNPAYN